MHPVSIQAYISKRDACGKLRLWSTTCGRPQSKGVANLTSSWHHFSVWDKILYSKALKGLADTWVTRPPKCVSVIIPIDTFLNSLSSFISATYRDCIKKYTHTIPLSGKTTTTKKPKRGKNQIPALPTAKQMSTKPSWLSPQLSSKCARTHTLSYKHTRALQPQVEREGDASKGSVWTVAATAPPPPRPLYTTMNKWSHDIRCFHPSRHCSNSQSQKLLFCSQSS